MKENPKVSVIVPVYNASNYLNESLNGILNQSFVDIEIILVNDGSLDNSGEICNKYAKKDNRIKVINKENEGAATARNIGIEIASGKYLIFLDADDIFSNKLIEVMYKTAEKKNADIVFCNFNRWLMDEDVILHNMGIYYRDVSDEEFNFGGKAKYQYMTTPAPWNKLYKSEFVKRNRIKYQNLTSCNDVSFFKKSVILATRIYCVNEELVTHRINSGNITSKRHLHAVNILRANVDVRDFILENKKIGYLDEFYRGVLSNINYEHERFDKKYKEIEFIKKTYDFFPEKYHSRLKRIFGCSVNNKVSVFVILLNENLNELLSVIESLFNQTILGDKIIIWVSKEKFNKLSEEIHKKVSDFNLNELKISAYNNVEDIEAAINILERRGGTVFVANNLKTYSEKWISLNLRSLSLSERELSNYSFRKIKYNILSKICFWGKKKYYEEKYNKQYLLSFFVQNNEDIRDGKKSVLIVEWNNFHGEVLPGYIKYLKELNFSIDVILTDNLYNQKPLVNISGIRVLHFQRYMIERLFRDRLFLKYDKVIFNSHLIFDENHWISFFEKFPILELYRDRIYTFEHRMELVDEKLLSMNHVFVLAKNKFMDNRAIYVNSHYFCDIRPKEKNKKTRFIVVGAINPKRKNFGALLSSIDSVINSGLTEFHVTIIGAGKLQEVPDKISSFISFLGKVDFEILYSEMKKSDFFLTLLDPNNVDHDRYITTSSSGSFQLIYGFKKPCLIAEKFAISYNFNSDSAIIYKDNSCLGEAMVQAIKMDSDTYSYMQNNIFRLSKIIYDDSLSNLKRALLN